MVRNQQTYVFIAGIVLMGLGGLFLVAQLLGGNFWAYFWPYPIIAAGLTFFVAMLSRGRGAGGLAIPGSITTAVGVILFIQNSFDWWESWAFAWTFIVTAVGIGIFVMGVWNESEKAKRNGLYIGMIGVLLLVPFGTFFGLGFSFLGFSFASRVIWPLMLIGIGAFLALLGIVGLSQRLSNVNRESSIPESHPGKMTEVPTQNVTT